MENDEAELPPELVREKRALIEVIEAAFGGVTREGGVSWSESRAIDDYGDAAARAAARAKDRDRSWAELVDDEAWNPDMGIGGWSFLDPIGFRYYLPAALVRSLKTGYDVGIQFHLTLPRHVLREHSREQWSLLDPGQRYAIARFLRLMIARERAFGSDREAFGWRRAYESYWASLPPPTGGPVPY